MNILVFGIGNPGRQDDALGPDIVDAVQAHVETCARAPASDSDPLCRQDIQFDANYQLNVEDAEAISHCDIVVFVDATVENLDGPFTFHKVDPEPTASFSTHSVSPGGIVALCEQMYNRTPAVYMLAVRGYAWEFNSPMTQQARQNQRDAVDFLTSALCEAVPEDPDDYSLMDKYLS